MSNNEPIVQVLPDAVAVAAAAAKRFAALARQSVARHGRFSVALAGGSTPRALYRLLAQPPYQNDVPWDHVYLFWSDERCVPPDDPESNFLLAREALLDHITMPAANVFPVPTIGGTPEAAAQAYSETISSFLGDTTRFDLILLGVGPDGHTASLFPSKAEVLQPPTSHVIAVHNAPKPPPDRISFALSLINTAEHVLVLATGAEKAEAVRRSLRPQLGEAPPPAGHVRPVNGEVVWLVDQAAYGRSR